MFGIWEDLYYDNKGHYKEYESYIYQRTRMIIKIITIDYF